MLELSDTEQNERMLVLEDDFETWDDRIVTLEATVQDIQNRLMILEETILSKFSIWIPFQKI